MNTSENNPNELDDAQLERLLFRFFASEMPADLRPTAALPQPETSAADAPPESARRLTGARTVIAALSLLLAASVLWHFSTHSSRDGDSSTVGRAPVKVLPIASGDKAPQKTIGFSLKENVQPVESMRYNTSFGPVEQRTNLTTTK